MNFVRYNPFREFDDLFTRAGFAQTNRPTSNQWVPRADVTENESGYVIELDIPGVAKTDVNVSLHEGVLRISGETKAHAEPEEDSKVRLHRRERVYGKFERSFKLPDDVDSEGVDARFSDGVLYLQVPRAEQAKPKAIEVQVN